jgi:hypothetical protein
MGLINPFWTLAYRTPRPRAAPASLSCCLAAFRAVGLPFFQAMTEVYIIVDFDTMQYFHMSIYTRST